MGGDCDENVAVDDESTEEKKQKEVIMNKKKKKKGFLCRMWKGLFRSGKDDFEGRLERISQEEASVLTQMRRRALSWGRWKRHLILFSLLLEVVAVGYALMTARTTEDWKIRAKRVLPMFLLPALSYITYSAVASFIKMCERNDKNTLEKLRVERQSKIDELKEKSNYYITQQLIQRYDTDPAAKAAAATVLASKLGADSGLKVFLGDEPKLTTSSGKSSDVELMLSSGLRNRKQGQSSATSPLSTMQHSGELSPHMASEYVDFNQQLLVDRYQRQGPTAYNNGWLSRLAALLVGEDPTQCYALICGNCHMHNGLASKEDFPYVTYKCPHCHVVNGPRIRQDRPSDSNFPKMGPTVPAILSSDTDSPNLNPTVLATLPFDSNSSKLNPTVPTTLPSDSYSPKPSPIVPETLPSDRNSPKLNPMIPSDIDSASNILDDSPCDNLTDNDNPEADALSVKEVVETEVRAADNH